MTIAVQTIARINNRVIEGWLRVLGGLVEASWGVLTDHGLILEQTAICGRSAIKTGLDLKSVMDFDQELAYCFKNYDLILLYNMFTFTFV